MSPSIEKTPSTTTRTPPPSPAARSQHPLELVDPVVAEGAKLGAGEAAAVEDRGVVAGVADHRVAGPEDGPDAADVGLVAGGEDERRLGSHPLGELGLELGVQRDRAVQQPRAGERGPVGLERVAGRVLDPLVAGQPEVVVGAEHDRLAALHLDHRPGLRGEQPEVGEHVALAGELELLGAVVVAGLGEDVGLDPGGRRAASLIAGIVPPADAVAAPWSSA